MRPLPAALALVFRRRALRPERTPDIELPSLHLLFFTRCTTSGASAIREYQFRTKQRGLAILGCRRVPDLSGLTATKSFDPGYR
jgi:hypothetical protein